jgi:hypothetical protein
MRVVGVCVLGVGLVLCGCSRKSEANKKEPETLGQRAGKAAYWAAKEAELAAQKAGKQLQQGAKQVHKGWTEAAQNDRNKRNAKPDERDK